MCNFGLRIEGLSANVWRCRYLRHLRQQQRWIIIRYHITILLVLIPCIIEINCCKIYEKSYVTKTFFRGETLVFVVLIFRILRKVAYCIVLYCFIVASVFLQPFPSMLWCLRSEFFILFWSNIIKRNMSCHLLAVWPLAFQQHILHVTVEKCFFNPLKHKV